MSIAETLDTQRTQEIGYRAETTDGTSDITVGSPTTYQFGSYSTSWGRFPQYRYDLLTGYRGATFDPYEIRLAKSIVDGAISFIPSNAQMLYHALCTSGGSASGVTYVDNGGGNYTYTLTPVQNLKPKSMTIRYDTSNGTEFHRKDVVGSRVSRLAYNFDFGLSDAVLNTNMNYMSINMQDSLVTTNVTPEYADGNTLEEQEEYTYNRSSPTDSIMEVVWDEGGDNVDLVPYLMDFNHIINIPHRFRPVDGQL